MIIAQDLGSIYSSLDLRLNSFEANITRAIQGFYRLQTNTENSSKLMDKSVYTATSNIEKSYRLWESSNNGVGKSVEVTNKKVDMLKQQMGLFDAEIKKSERTLANIEIQCGENSKEAEEYRSHLLDLKLAHSGLADEVQKSEKQLNTFSGKMNLLGEEFEKIDKKYAVFDKVGSTLSGLGNKLTLGVTMPLAAAGTAATKFAMDFGNGAAKVSTIADTTKASIDELKTGVINLSNKTGMSTKDLNESLYQSISASVDTADAVGFLDVAVKASIGGFSDTTTAVNGLTTVLNSYGLQATEADKIANQMLITQNIGKTSFAELASTVGKVTPVAAALGLKTEELFSSLAVTTAQGLATAESVTALKAAMSNIIKPSKEATEAAESLGIEFSVSALQSKGWINFLQDMKEGLKGASPEVDSLVTAIEKASSTMTTLESAGKKNSDEYKQAKKNLKTFSSELEMMSSIADSPVSAMAKMFGSVEGLNSILMLTSEQGLAKYNETMKQMETNTGALDDAYTKMSETTEFKLKKALNSAKNSAMELGVKLLPLVERGINLFQGLIDKLDKMSPAMQEWIIKVGLASMALGPLLKIVGGTVSGIGGLAKITSKAGVAFGLFKNTANVASAATSSLGSTSAVAAGASGVGGLTTGLGVLSKIGLPVAGVIAGIGAAMYVAHEANDLYNDSILKSTEEMSAMEVMLGNLTGATMYSKKELTKMGLVYEDFNEKISPKFREEVKKSTKELNDFSLFLGEINIDKVITEDESNEFNSRVSTMCVNAIETIKNKQAESTNALKELFVSDGILDESEKKVLSYFDRTAETSINEVTSLENEIYNIKAKALEEKRGLNEAEIVDIETKLDRIKQLELEALGSNEAEVMYAKKDFIARVNNIDLEGASELIKEKSKIRNEEIIKIRASYDTEIEMIKSNLGKMDETTRKAALETITKLETDRDKKIGVEESLYEEYLRIIGEKNPEILDKINEFNGEILSKGDKKRKDELTTELKKYADLNKITEDGVWNVYNTQTGAYDKMLIKLDETTGQVIGLARLEATEEGFTRDKIIAYTEDIKKSMESEAETALINKNKIINALRHWTETTVDSNGNVVDSNGEVVFSLENIKEGADGLRRGVLNLNGTPIEVEVNKDGTLRNVQDIIDRIGKVQDKTVTLTVQEQRIMRDSRSTIEMYATGTSAMGLTRSVTTTMNEKGYELYNLPQGSRIYNNQASEALITKTATRIAEGLLLENEAIMGNIIEKQQKSLNIDYEKLARVISSSTRDIQQNIKIVSDKLSPSETANKIKRLDKELALGW